MRKCDIGIYGLGIMGQNLAINFASREISVSVFNHMGNGEDNTVADFISFRCQGLVVAGSVDLIQFVSSIEVPRKIILMVKAGSVVDEVLDQLIPLLDAGDVIIDCGNSHYRDTARRLSTLESQGIHFVGCGISGGGEGALKGASIMAGGSSTASARIMPLLREIAAKSENGEPCCAWIGPEGSGHFAKMAHNGIEYALMQIIAESYDIMVRMLSMTPDEIVKVISEWNDAELQGYLLRISSDILKMKNNNGRPLLENILDCAAHKGTVRDISISALELGVPVTTIIESLSARFVSCMIDERRCASTEFTATRQYSGNRQEFLTALRDAVYCSQFIAYLQGLRLMASASAEYGWNMDMAGIFTIWRRGSIVQSSLLDQIAERLNQGNSEHLLLETYFAKRINEKQENWRCSIAAAMQCGIPVPALSSTLTYFDAFRSERLPANLIQAQREYFGAHGYERLDAPAGTLFHMRNERMLDAGSGCGSRGWVPQ